MRQRIWVLTALVLGLALASPLPASGAAAGELVGTFAISPGSCQGAVSGSYFRMILPSGGADGPYVANGDSSCSDDSYSPLLPGTDGGLVTGGYQPSPSPAFDESGNGTAKRITQPTPFFGVMFATSTEQVDPQTGARLPAPSISVDANGKLTGVLSSFGASWNGQSFNQGSPKPDGSYPGNTTRVTGTYNASSGAFELNWSSQIEGGPFDDFTGVWHLVGTFRPKGGTATPAQGPTGGSATPQTSPSGAPDLAPVEDGADEVAPALGDAPVAGPEEAAALGDGVVSTSVTTTDDGFQPAAWLVVVLGAAGIIGVLWLVWLTRSPTAPPEP